MSTEHIQPGCQNGKYKASSQNLKTKQRKIQMEAAEEYARNVVCQKEKESNIAGKI